MVAGEDGEGEHFGFASSTGRLGDGVAGYEQPIPISLKVRCVCRYGIKFLDLLDQNTKSGLMEQNAVYLA